MKRRLPVSAPISRRQFATLIGASLGAAACRRAPEEEIIPYVERPPELVPGKATRYATTLTRAGFGLGILAECHAGRPTKLEGNSDHPASWGATGRSEQAALLDLYSAHRQSVVLRNHAPSSKSEFTNWLGRVREGLRDRAGAGVAIVLPASTSMTLSHLLDRLREHLPKVAIYFINSSSARDASRLAFGEHLESIYDFSRADCICAIDADFLDAEGPLDLRYCGQWGKRRRIKTPEQNPGRLYSLEASLSVTGASADERFPIEAPDIHAATHELLTLLKRSKEGSARFPFLRKLADELSLHRGRSLVVCGERQPMAVQLLCAAANQLLGNTQSTIQYVPSPVLQGQPLSELRDSLDAGAVDLLFTVDVDPLRHLPPDHELSSRLQRAKERVALCQFSGPMASQATWLLPSQHPLERWGDARAQDGTLSFTQPLLEPLGECMAPEELLSLLLEEHPKVGRDWFDTFWTDARIREVGDAASLHDCLAQGLVRGSAAAPTAATLDPEAILRSAAPAPASAGLSLELRPDPRLALGEKQHNDWLQELPDPITRLSWGNALFVSASLAEQRGLRNRDLVELRAGDAKVEVPLWIKPGQPKQTLTVWLGHGERCGVDVSSLRRVNTPWVVQDVAVTPLGRRDDQLVCVQTATTQESRPIALNIDLHTWRNRPDSLREHNEDPPSVHPQRLRGSPQWGMVIDLNACTGCSVCVLACQAENNIPSVGPADAALGRTMHWLRVDRYFSEGGDESMAQPMACQHCEKAPCEYVCPVGATTHSPDGLNEMTYNRCVGTRFCSNNCPYKVRRFNWREYAPTPGQRQVLLENPSVTVRARGVMEKCTYCVQRIRRAEIDSKLEHRPLRDGDAQTACAQACPTDAITFGDITDSASAVSRQRESSRIYGVLAEEGTRPRTRYLARVRNKRGGQP